MPRARILGLAALLAIPFAPGAGRASTSPQIVFSSDRAPSVSGEIYRLDPNGRRVDLSRSPYQDHRPVVSTDGKNVAFLSDRGGSAGAYEVGIDGRGLTRIAPSLELGSAQLAWRPHGSSLAAELPGSDVSSGRVWIVQAHRKPITVSRRFGFATAGIFGAQNPWSPDGHVLLVWAQRGMRAVSPQGRTLWRAAAHYPIATWSSSGLVAVTAHQGVAVYDERGRERALFRVQIPRFTAVALAWSPSGRYLAVQWNRTLEVRTADGRLVLEKTHVPSYETGWAGNGQVAIGEPGCSGCGSAIGIDIHTGRTSKVSSAWLDPLLPDRRLAIVTPTSGGGFSLGVAPPSGGTERHYATVGGCFSDGEWMPAASSLQFAGRSHSLVYESWSPYCDAPFSNLYSVAPGGGKAKRLTDVQSQETQPAVSPDGSKIAYVWAAGIGQSCKGCSDGIRVAAADGTALRTLTDPQDCTFDDSPTWSPDGSTILFSRANCDGPPSKLYSVPAGGGAVRDLGVVGVAPAWGPSRIAYEGKYGRGIWTAKPDGSHPVEVATEGKSPAWSSAGRLAYLVGSTGRTVVVGSTRTTLPFGLVKSLAWSPDGTRFVVVARMKHAPAFDVYTVKTDGTDPVRLTTNYDASGVSWG